MLLFVVDRCLVFVVPCVLLVVRDLICVVV